MTTLADIAKQLEAPFAIQDIDLLPKGKFEKNGQTMCMALPYADKRVYEDRLNELAPGEWSTLPPIAIVAGNKLLVYVTVVLFGVSHTDVGEAVLVDERGKPSENAGTESWAQAFKRACSQFGLGRYLYDLEKIWVPYNPQKKVIDLDPHGVLNIVRQMYAKAHIALPQQPAKKDASTDKPALQPQEGMIVPATPVVVTKEPASEVVATPVAIKRTAQPPATTKATSSLHNEVSALKSRAKALGVASNVEEWSALLSRFSISEIASPADVAKVGGYLTQVEKEQSVATPINAPSAIQPPTISLPFVSDAQWGAICKLSGILGEKVDEQYLATLTIQQVQQYVAGLSKRVNHKKSA